MPKVLDIVTLRSFVTVAACGGFHRAAQPLHLTQAAVSRHVQRLEDTVGQVLIERDGRGIRFTAAGQDLLAYARTILDAHDEALGHFGRNPARVITVGAMDHAADELLPDLIRQLREVLPGRRFEFRVGRSASLRRSLAARQLDIAIVLRRLTGDDGEPNAVPTRWLHAAGAPAEPGSDDVVPLVVFDHACGLRTGAIDALRGAGRQFAIAAQAADLTGIHAATRAGLGYTLLPAIGRVPDRLTVAGGLPEAPRVSFGVETSDRLPPRDAQRIVQAIEDHLSQFPDSAGRDSS
jgi:DNA-binding transcriptional LysR family regulator